MRRVVVIEISYLPPYVFQSDRYMIVLTVVDPIRHSQLFRFDKTPMAAIHQGGIPFVELSPSKFIFPPPIMYPGFLLPGITAFMSVVVTICAREESMRFHVAEQAQLVMRDIDDFLATSKHTIKFVKSIMVGRFILLNTELPLKIF